MKTFYGKNPMGNPAPLLVQMLHGTVNVHDSINYREQKFYQFCFWYSEQGARKYGMMDKVPYNDPVYKILDKQKKKFDVYFDAPLLPR